MLPLTEADQQTLLRMARESLVGFLHFAEIPKVGPPGEALLQLGGAFVTLHKGKNLRGCVGITEARQPLYKTIQQCAVWAALNDTRFPPVTKREVRGLTFEISVLSPPFDIAPEKIEVGQHGLVISRGTQRGLLLPQVAVEWKWDRVQFLEHTCEKAGLPPGAWRQEARIQAFTAQVFDESQHTSSSHSAA
jgi:AmmeMemoRadiSam system protein A